MAHVQIKMGPRPHVIVDGHDITDHLLAEGFGVEFSDVPWETPSKVRMVLAADTLEVDLPEAVVDALRSDV